MCVCVFWGFFCIDAVKVEFKLMSSLCYTKNIEIQTNQYEYVYYL